MLLNVVRVWGWHQRGRIKLTTTNERLFFKSAKTDNQTAKIFFAEGQTEDKGRSGRVAESSEENRDGLQPVEKCI